MEYRDVMEVIPATFLDRFPSPGNHKPNPEKEPWKFRWDYKTSYRDSPYFIRRGRPNVEYSTVTYTNIDVTTEDMDLKIKENPEFRSKSCFYL